MKFRRPLKQKQRQIKIKENTYNGFL